MVPQSFRFPEREINLELLSHLRRAGDAFSENPVALFLSGISS